MLQRTRLHPLTHPPTCWADSEGASGYSLTHQTQPEPARVAHLVGTPLLHLRWRTPPWRAPRHATAACICHARTCHARSFPPCTCDGGRHLGGLLASCNSGMCHARTHVPRPLLPPPHLRWRRPPWRAPRIMQQRHVPCTHVPRPLLPPPHLQWRTPPWRAPCIMQQRHVPCTHVPRPLLPPPHLRWRTPPWRAPLGPAAAARARS